MRLARQLAFFVEFLSILITVDVITPVCFNCHCSTYTLDITIKCKDAVFNKTSYFTLWTKSVTVAEGSDVVLAAEIKDHSEEYCWCTDARLEWNGLYQNSSGRLLVVNIKNASKTETGHFWSVLYLHKTFYFSDPVYLNVTGPDTPVPSPDLELDPKMSALVVGILFVVIMFFGIAIYCCNMAKRRAREKDFKKFQDAEARLPLQWDLQHPENIIQETDMEMNHVYDPTPRTVSDLEEEGSCTTSIRKETSPSISSEDQQEENKTKKEDEKEDAETDEQEQTKSRKDPTTVISNQQVVEPRRESVISVVPVESARYPSRVELVPVVSVPITDDRFTTQRSWYTSLNTEVVSESLLCNKEHVEKKREKKRRKSKAKSSTGLASGILKAGDLGSGFMGSSSQLHQERVDKMQEMYNTLTRDFQYGRSLPTPQPAGARPTVMTIFPNHASALAYHRPGNTIHSTNPGSRRHVRSLFNETAPLTKHKRSRSVQFSDNNITKRFNSLDNLPATPPSTKRVPKLKSSLKSNNNSEKLESSSSESTSSSGKTDCSARTGASLPVMKLYVPQDIPVLDLTPASPTSNRFTVKRVESDNSLESESAVIDPLLGPRCWDFSSEEDFSRNGDKRIKMDHLTVPGLLGSLQQLDNQLELDGHWSA